MSYFLTSLTENLSAIYTFEHCSQLFCFFYASFSKLFGRDKSFPAEFYLQDLEATFFTPKQDQNLHLSEISISHNQFIFSNALTTLPLSSLHFSLLIIVYVDRMSNYLHTIFSNLQFAFFLSSFVFFLQVKKDSFYDLFHDTFFHAIFSVPQLASNFIILLCFLCIFSFLLFVWRIFLQIILIIHDS